MTNESRSSGAGGSVLLFDGVCNLCNGAVQFIIKRDPHARIRFAALQSDAAKNLLRSINAAESQPDSMILLENGRVHTRSTAALRIAKSLRFPWPIMYVFVIVPRPLRNWMYDFIAARRYRWFGKRETCMLPTPELQSRFLA